MGDHQWIVFGNITLVVTIVVISNRSRGIDFCSSLSDTFDLKVSCAWDWSSQSLSRMQAVKLGPWPFTVPYAGDFYPQFSRPGSGGY